MAKKTKKLTLKSETLRRLDALNDDQLRVVGGGSAYEPGSGACGGGLKGTGTGPSRTDTPNLAAMNFYFNYYP